MTLEKVSYSLHPSALKKKSRDNISTVYSVMFVQTIKLFEKGTTRCHGFAYMSLLRVIVSFHSGDSCHFLLQLFLPLQ